MTKRELLAKALKAGEFYSETEIDRLLEDLLEAPPDPPTVCVCGHRLEACYVEDEGYYALCPSCGRRGQIGAGTKAAAFRSWVADHSPRLGSCSTCGEAKKRPMDFLYYCPQRGSGFDIWSSFSTTPCHRCWVPKS
jgi:hypothetical protein